MSLLLSAVDIAVASYGSTEAGQTQRARAWHAFGTPVSLLLSTAPGLGRQCFALGLIVAEVLFSHHYLMNCNPMACGVPVAVACEYTKAYVRCFPLLGIIVSLMVASRQLLQHRMYYEMLRHGALLDIDNFSPSTDPLFRLIIWCTCNACLHFALNMWKAHSKSFEHLDTAVDAVQAEGFKNEVERVAVFYMVPSVLFVIFLWGSYDTEAALLPLSKYFEEDPEDARQELSKMPFVSESAAAAAVETPERIEELFQGSKVRTAAQAEKVYQRLLEHALEADRVPEKRATLSEYRLVSTLWPAELLLHKKLQDESSLNFRYMWFAFSAAGVVLIGGIFVFFNWLVVKKIEDIIEGQYTDISGIVIIVLHVITTVWLAICFLKNASVTFRT